MSQRLLLSSKSLARSAQLLQPRASSCLMQQRSLSQAEIEDPGMNGGYVNPPRIKRQFRDPYGDWWDKQERRNYGEPVHEDNDILGVFSTEAYTHFSVGKAWFLLSSAVAVGCGVAGAVYLTYPDRPSVPRTFPDGLEAELGGPGALRARKHGEE